MTRLCSVPSDHQSTLLLCPRDCSTSGARYSGVPHSVQLRSRISCSLSSLNIYHYIVYIYIYLRNYGGHLVFRIDTRYDQRRRRRRLLNTFLGEPEVGDDGVAAAIEEDVLGLEVAVDDAAAVEVGQRRHDLRRVEPHAGHREAALLPAQGK